MATKTFCDICGNHIKIETNCIRLMGRRGLDGTENSTYDACDDCFKTFQLMCWSNTKRALKELRNMNDEQKRNFIIRLKER